MKQVGGEVSSGTQIDTPRNQKLLQVKQSIYFFHLLALRLNRPDCNCSLRLGSEQAFISSHDRQNFVQDVNFEAMQTLVIKVY